MLGKDEAGSNEPWYFSCRCSARSPVKGSYCLCPPSSLVEISWSQRTRPGCFSQAACIVHRSVEIWSKQSVNSLKICWFPDVLWISQTLITPKDHPESVDGSDYSYFFFVIKAILLKPHSLSHEPMSGSCLGHTLLLSMKITESHWIGL